LAHNTRILHIVKWFPHEDDPQNGVFILRHIEAVAPHVDNCILFIREVPHQKKFVRVHKYNHPCGRVYEIRLSAKKTLFQKHAFKLATFQQFISRIHRPELIHFHIGTPDQSIAALAASLRGIPYIVSEHWSGFLDDRFEKIVFHKKWMIRRMMSKAIRVLPVSKILMKGMMQAGIQAAYRVVPNVVHVALSSQLKYPDFTFAVLGDLDDAIKNLSGTIKAFSVHAKSHPHSRLEIIGGGPDEAALKALVNKLAISGKVTFHGRKAQEEAMETLAACHCLIINSRTETFSIVGLEALSLGIPVISTRCGGPEEYLNEKVAILVKPDDELALSAALAQMETYHALYASKASAFDTSRWDMRRIGNTIVQLYDAILRVKALGPQPNSSTV
jgi:glycosyltransferase involved in cell wall biosynthesis